VGTAAGILLLATVAAGSVGSFTVGSVNVGSINTTQGSPLTQVNLANEVPDRGEADSEIKVGGSIKQFHGKPVGVPTPAGQSVSDAGGATGFSGVDHFDQRTADGGNQFSLEPPDQALCVGNGYVVEGVNLAFNVYDTSGSKLAGPVAYNPFFTRSDPQCERRDHREGLVPERSEVLLRHGHGPLLHDGPRRRADAHERDPADGPVHRRLEER